MKNYEDGHNLIKTVTMAGRKRTTIKTITKVRKNLKKITRRAKNCDGYSKNMWLTRLQLHKRVEISAGDSRKKS